MAGTNHSKRFSATREQLHILRQQIATYAQHHWRAAFHADIAKRQQLGQQLLACQPPEVRIDHFVTQSMLMVDRAFANSAAPELPDVLVRMK